MLRLREIRESKKISQATVARDLNLSRQGYGYYESGQRKPSLSVLQQLADYFEVSVDYILGLEPKERTSFNFQRFGSASTRISYLAGKVAAMPDSEQKEKTCSIIEQVLRLSDEQRDKLFELLKVI